MRCIFLLWIVFRNRKADFHAPNARSYESREPRADVAAALPPLFFTVSNVTQLHPIFPNE